MIVDYEVSPGADVISVFAALDVAAEANDVCLEGMHSPRPGKPGRAYLAVPAALTAESVMTHLAGAKQPVTITLAHPR
jgi:hypothetical protein